MLFSSSISRISNIFSNTLHNPGKRLIGLYEVISSACFSFFFFKDFIAAYYGVVETYRSLELDSMLYPVYFYALVEPVDLMHLEISTFHSRLEFRKLSLNVMQRPVLS